MVSKSHFHINQDIIRKFEDSDTFKNTGSDDVRNEEEIFKILHNL